MKNSFVLYTDYLEHIQDMDLEQLGTLFLAIFHYQRGEDLPEMDAETNMAFKFIRFQLDKDNKKYEETTEKRNVISEKSRIFLEREIVVNNTW